jgi:predicted component of type VI protein secretion system
MAGTNYQLTVRVGPNPGKVYLLDKPEMVVGRDLTADIVISDSEVSRKHAHFTLTQGGYVLEDLGSTNGTIVNGDRLAGPHLMRPGEELTLGEHVTLIYEAAAVDPDATQVAVNASSPRAPATVIEPAPIPAPIPAFDEPFTPLTDDYSGQVPEQPVQVQPKPAKKRIPTWAIIVIVAVLVLIFACAASIEIIDANNLWCTLFPFLPGCP